MDEEEEINNGAQGVQNEHVNGDQMPLYPDDYDDKRTRIKKIIFFGIMGLMVAIALIISFSRGVARHASYLLLGFTILCITLVEISLCWLLRVGQLDREKEWFIYFVGVCIIIQAIFTDVLLFD